MKSMLYVGASLMIGASIYGFVDYKQNHNKKEFTQMYSEGKPSTPKTAEPITAAEEKKSGDKTVRVSKVETKATKSGKSKKASTKIQAPRVDNAEPAVVTNVEPDTRIDPAPEPNVNKTKKKKKLNHKIFSRAPLRDEEYPDEDSVTTKN